MAVFVSATLALLSTQPAAAGPEAVFTHFRYAGSQPAHARNPLPRGYYRNPVIQGSYSDPTILRVGRDYYLTNASLNLYPGLPIFHSRDLVHWRQIGSAIDRPDQVPMARIDSWLGIYAPALAYHDGIFYLITTCQGCGGNFVLTARAAGGPWSNPHWLPFEGIDPSLFVADDGRAWVVNNGPPSGKPRYDGHRAIWLQEIDLATFTMKGPRTVIVDGGADRSAKPFWIEGPHLYRKDGFYHLICAEGGTKERHSEVAFRAASLHGPWTAAPRPILSQLDLDRSRRDPVVQAGHADMVRTPAGDWWAVFLASRPWGAGELDYNTGRETFLLPVRWTDGWPIILPPRTPVPLVTRAPALPPAPTGEPHGGDYTVTDDFAAARLAHRWSMLLTPTSTWWRSGGGALRLQARPVPLGSEDQPSFVGIRQQHMNASVTIDVRFRPRTANARAGLTAYQGVRRFLALSVGGRADGGREVRLDRMAGDGDPPGGTPVATAPLPPVGTVGLRIDIAGPRYTFFYRPQGRSWRLLGQAQDGAILSTTSAKGFTGVYLGPFAYSPP